ncbi:MAG TPA: bis(5'-nucleosyl)-tetraphosphatase (symmetrical) YqeK, partial [Mobilitalea sp.]|nr:bis(5'-nucleosyl)-tetraphosphatase (symmetrical) YqeK [Mobilitalea sp.]
MDLDQMRQTIKGYLKESRYQHSIGVEEASCDLAYIYGYDPEKAAIAAVLHDCAKHLSDEELLKECEHYHLPVTKAEAQNVQLLHAKVGAAYAKDKFGVENEEIIN